MTAPIGGRRRTPALAAAVALTLLATGCGEPAPRPGVILVSVDTLRPDHLGCYGYPRPTSPRIDHFRNEAVLFRQAISHAPSTLASHASMLSGLLPYHHRASWEAKTRLPEEAVTLAELLRDAGYATAAITGGGQMQTIFGLDQGFDRYEIYGRQDLGGAADAAIRWLERAGGSEFFLFLHRYHVHHPYDPDPEVLALFEPDGYDGPLPDAIGPEILDRINSGELEIGDADRAHVVATYDAEIREMDAGFGRLVDWLEASGLAETTLLILTSDHGEELGEHGAMGWHSHTLYDELLRVPLLARFPGGRWAGGTVDAQVRLQDLPATILGAVGIEPPAGYGGVDLANLLGAEAPEDLIAVSQLDRAARRPALAIRDGRLKLYRDLLIDLGNDPLERWDASVNFPGATERLRAAIEAAHGARERLPKIEVAPAETTLEELRALGYFEQSQ